MIEYNIGKNRYILHYSELRDKYITHLEMSDEEFMKNLPSALHLACIICFLKETPTYICLADDGIVHELTHLLQHGDGDTIELKKIRKLFKKQLKLA